MNCLDFIYVKGCNEVENGISLNEHIDFSVSRMAHLSSVDKPTTQDVIKNLLTIAKNDAISKVFELDEGYQFNRKVVGVKDDYGFTTAPILSDTSTLVVRTDKYSNMLKQRITGITFQPLFDGEFTVTLNDGQKSETYELEAVNGVTAEYEFDFYTSQKEVTITIQSGLYFNMVEAPEGGCGPCGGGKKYEYLTTSVWKNVSMNYPVIGIPHAVLECDSENLVCMLINSPRFKQEFVKLVAYIFISLALRKALTSERDNETTFDKETIEKELIMYIGHEKNGIVQQGLIDDVVYGKKGNGGISKIVKETIRMSRDYCIYCTQKINKANMHF